jgi:TetR/AcrR family transcriptional regulator, cholesterol catabolism regulator
MNSMGRTNQQAHRRELLIAAARRVAVRDGATGTTLRAIAAEANMEPNAVLYYFDTLGELVRELVRVVSAEFIAQVESAVANETSSQARLAAAIRAGLTGGLDNDLSTILYEYWSMSLRDPEMKVVEAMLVDRQTAIYEEIVNAGIATGDFRVELPTSEIARLLLALEDGLAMGILSGSNDRSRTLSSVLHTAEALVGQRLSANSQLGAGFQRTLGPS